MREFTLTDNTGDQSCHNRCLYVVATPIGNLADMVPRAVDVLQSVDLIAAEDTRHSKRLLQHFNILTPVVAYHDHTAKKSVESLINSLLAGQSVALISDAGTPLISDPGYRIVSSALDAGIRVVPVPGASAAITALSVAGLPSDRFVFEGFLPAKQVARLKHLQKLQDETRTLIFYEAPHRLLSTLQDMTQVFGHMREAVLARELTKAFETVKRTTLSDLCDWVQADSNQQRGECVVLVRGASAEACDDLEARRVLDILLEQLPLKQASALAARITGAKKNQLYQYGLQRQ